MFSPEERRIVVVSSVAHALVHAEMLVFGVVLVPLARALRLSLVELGFIGTISYVCFGAGAPLGGWLADRWGAGRVLALSMLGSAAALAFVASARAPVDLAVGFVGLGLAASLYHPAGLGLVSTRVRALGRALGLHGVAGNLGLALTPVAAAALTDRWGWSAPYAILAVITAAVGAALLFWVERATPAAIEPLDQSAASVRGRLSLLLTLGAVLGLVYRGTLTFLPARFLEVFAAVDPEHALSRAGLVVSGALLAGIVGQLAAGKAIERAPAETLLPLTLLLAAPLLVVVAASRGGALVLAAFVFVILHFATQPLTNAMLAAYSTPAMRSRVYGLAFALSFGVGALAAGGGGYLADRWGVPAVFHALAALGVLALGASVALWRGGSRSPAVRAGSPLAPLP